MAIEKKIIVTSDSSQAESNFSKTASSIEGMMNGVADSVGNVSSKVSSLFDSFSSQNTDTKSIFNEMVRGAEQTAKSHAERAQYIEKEIQGLLRINQENEKRAQNESSNLQDTDLSAVEGDPELEKKAKEEHEKRLIRIKQASQLEKEQLLALQSEKDKYEAGQHTKDSSQGLNSGPQSTGDSGSAKSTEQRNSYDSGEALEDTAVAFQDLVEESNKYSESAKERLAYIEKELALLDRINREEKLRNEIDSRDQLDQDLSLAGEDEDKQGKAKEGHTQRMAQIAADAKKAQYQSTVFDRLKREHADNQPEEEPEEQPTTDKQPRRGFVSRASGFGKTVGAAALGAAGFGAILSIGGFIGNLVDQANQLGKAEARMGATGFKSGSVEGLKRAEEIEYSKNIAKAIGTGDVAKQVTEQGILERGTGMDVGSTTGFNTVMRSDKDGRTLTDSTVEMLNIMKTSGLYSIGKEDFTMLSELMSRSNELNSIQSNQADMIDSSRTNKLMAAFGAMGGSFGDQRQTGTIAGVNQDIRSGGNEFTNAFMMRSIVKNDPNASLWDTMKAKDEGVFKEGQFQSIVKDVFSSFKGDDVKFNLKELFPSLNYSQTETLHDEFKKDPDKFKNIESLEQLEEQVGTKEDISLESIQKRGGVGALEGWKSDFNDSMSKMGDQAINKIDSYVDAFKSHSFEGLAAKFSEDINSAITSAFDYGIDKFKNEITPGFTATVNEVTTSITDAGKPENKAINDAAEEQGGMFGFMAKTYKLINYLNPTDPSTGGASGESLSETNKLLREQNDMVRKQGTGDGSMLMVQPNTPAKNSSIVPNILTNSNLESVH